MIFQLPFSSLVQDYVAMGQSNIGASSSAVAHNSARVAEHSGRAVHAATGSMFGANTGSMSGASTAAISGALSVANRAGEPRLSEVLWGQGWSDVLACELSADGVRVAVADTNATFEFIRLHYSSIFGDAEHAGFWRDPDNARDQYLRHVCDVFGFWHHDQMVGVFVGNPVDWASYYIRSVAFLEDYQGRALGQSFTTLLAQCLRARGVVRLEADTALSNHQCVAALTHQRFVMSGTLMSERWGALSRFTKFLDPAAEEAYLSRFCASGAVHKRKRRSA